MTEEEKQTLTEMHPLINALFDVSVEFVTKSGGFLPHGATLGAEGDVKLVGGMPANDMTTSEEVLPLLHEGLRQSTAVAATRAVAVSESVFIGANQEPAIKVLAEHRTGLTLALYMPWKKRLLRAPAFGEIQMVRAEPEVGHWA
ncbi:hypothetical protein SAMN05444004_102171 [Jannaschia faecimaris]|uniref:Uncharacterized protein n=1 Tax=Jannaschia faecimaris TaxID=1244108 RepID=A0A1H3LF99_9RHOB|nr:hypothetical protein [Jannaschia faecimaris]SDY62624.1 hypothetical protein SAMN05444004_102171 [Jannaschia faecimaris]